MKAIRTQEQAKHEARMKKKAERMTLANTTHIYKGVTPCVLLEQGSGVLSKFVVFFPEGKALAYFTTVEVESVREWTERRMLGI